MTYRFDSIIAWLASQYILSLVAIGCKTDLALGRYLCFLRTLSNRAIFSLSSSTSQGNYNPIQIYHEVLHPHPPINPEPQAIACRQLQPPLAGTGRTRSDLRGIYLYYGQMRHNGILRTVDR